jgi:DNA polymerase/3'-5' exonuclease PolX
LVLGRSCRIVKNGSTGGAAREFSGSFQGAGEVAELRDEQLRHGIRDHCLVLGRSCRIVKNGSTGGAAREFSGSFQGAGEVAELRDEQLRHGILSRV